MAKKEEVVDSRAVEAFTHIVIVNPTISIEEMCRRLGVDYKLDSSKLGEWPDKKPFQRPNKPYPIRVQDGTVTIGESFDKVKLAPNERRPSAFEGLAIFAAKPYILGDHGLILTGTTVGPYDFVVLHNNAKGRPVMEPCPITVANKRLGIVTVLR